jgi:hypothetical protein
MPAKKSKTKRPLSSKSTLKRQKSFSGSQLLFFILIFALVGGLVVWKSLAATTSCTPRNPGVAVNNTYAWAQWGSYGTAGQQLTYAANVINYDIGCASSTFTLTATAPTGFSVTIPTSTITLKTASQGYVYATITSPNPIADGDYPLNFTVTRSSPTASSGSGTSYYKVYSSDTAAPSLYFPAPYDGAVISSRKGAKTYNFQIEANDNRSVKNIDTYIDGNRVASYACQDIAYSCGSTYQWPLRGQTGAHTAMFKAYDWFGNVGTYNANFSVN